ncbi:MAG: tetratricopeptide repeat protein [Candidatus Sumerlaeaceae bacterium]
MMATTHRSAAFLCVMMLALSAAWARLPEDGLAKAQEAERALKAGDPQHAIALLVELDATYPNEPAVNLRLAEIYDQQGQPGAALYYYRRYVQLAGQAARATAKERVQTLEMTAGAREAADVIAKRLGQKVRAVSTPTPVVQQAIEKLLPDGARVRVDSPEELMSDKVNPKKLVAPTPETSQHPLAKAEVIIRGSDETTAPSVSSRRTPSPVFTPPPIAHQWPDTQTAKPTLGPNEENETPRTSEPVPQPVSPNAHEEKSDLNPHAQAALIQPNKVSSTKTIPSSQDNQGEGRSSNRITIEFAPAERTSSAKPRAAASASSPTNSAEESAPTASPYVRLPLSDPAKFFLVYPSGGEKARLSLANSFRNAVVVFSALPATGGEPVNAIVGPGETRTYEVTPGRYAVHTKITDDSYPPVTLLDTRFDYEFQSGMSYARRFSDRERTGELR